MIALFCFIIIIGASIVLALRKKRPQFLLIPFASLLLYFTIEIALVPAPFLDTIKFIISLS
ncbi:hypothetical protein GJU40_19875 [Bacillus lacus]|uniref:Uncharacterized protein n=1 Tax=Metabacillus lacus TaxID=1983721 RepID=A0A7X2J371_9BACI|nr:hypothetical protein [Metabacillus lacus]MRX74382.1 hypothetical protein [Metabacillus lacus]